MTTHTGAAELPQALPPAFMHYPPKKPELARVDFFPMATKQERGSGWVTVALQAQPAGASTPEAPDVDAQTRKDAERYRWLRIQDSEDFEFSVVKNPHFDVYSTPEELDAAIDAALAAQGGAA